MSGKSIEEGSIVLNNLKPEWGPGKVLSVEGAKAHVYFPKAPASVPQDAIKLMSMSCLEWTDAQADPWLTHLPRFTDGKFNVQAKPITFEQAIQRFRAKYPLGFSDPDYLQDERNYKWEAHNLFESALKQFENNNEVTDDFLENIVRIFTAKINLLSQYEQMALREGLGNRSAAKQLFSSLIALLNEPDFNASAFVSYKEAVESLPAKPGRARVATWPILTVFPFIAAPDRFMFLKPEVTKQAADRLLFDLRYDSSLNWMTYSQLLQMSKLLFDKLDNFGVRDFIDVQSFIWVTGD
jgi:hypothetical protein